MSRKRDPLRGRENNLNRIGGDTRRRMRFDLGQFWGWLCWWCREPIDVDSSTLEHLWPLSRGGKTIWPNLRLACRPCNELRGNSRSPSTRVWTVQPEPRPAPWAPVPALSWVDLPPGWPVPRAGFPDPSLRSEAAQ